jgi:hypothetical protein
MPFSNMVAAASLLAAQPPQLGHAPSAAACGWSPPRAPDPGVTGPLGTACSPLAGCARQPQSPTRTLQGVQRLLQPLHPPVSHVVVGQHRHLHARRRECSHVQGVRAVVDALLGPGLGLGRERSLQVDDDRVRGLLADVLCTVGVEGRWSTGGVTARCVSGWVGEGVTPAVCRPLICWPAAPQFLLPETSGVAPSGAGRQAWQRTHLQGEAPHIVQPPRLRQRAVSLHRRRAEVRGYRVQGYAQSKGWGAQSVRGRVGSKLRAAPCGPFSRMVVPE